MKNTTGKLDFNYFKISGIDIDVSKIETLDIYESIEFPGIEGTVLIDDWQSIKELLNIFAGDIIEISFGRTIDTPLVLEYVITDAPNEVILPGQDNRFIELNFCSAWLVEGYTQNRSRVWKNKYIYEIVSDLVEECGGEMGVVERTKQKLERFVSPFWSPIKTINYLMTFATDYYDNGGYLLFTDIKENKVNFIPYNRLISSEINYGYVPFKLKMNLAHSESPERILNLTISSSYDILKYGNVGLGRSRMVGFNYDKTEIMEIDKRIDEYDHNHLSTKLPLNTKFLGEKYRTTKESFLYPNTDELITDKPVEGDTYIRKASELLDGKLYTKQSLTFSDLISLDLITLGEGVHKKVGRLVWVDIPSRGFKIKSLNKQYTGTYLIKNLRHSIEKSSYTNIITVVSDGFKDIVRDDLVKWVGGNYYNENSTITDEG